MKALKVIGNFFVKIWRWIKETAWVQPLLIVGAIFAVIFSIPYFTNWINDFGFGSSNAYYASYQYSLEGEVKDQDDVSQADKLTNALYDGSDFYGDLTADRKSAIISQYGEKFFVAYVSKSCTECESARPAFDILTNGWDSTYTISDDRQFKMCTIFTDEESSTDDDDVNSLTAFQRYLDNHKDFFECAGGRMGDDQTPYRYNAGLESSSDYDSFTNADHDSFKTPTVLLIDFSAEAEALGRMGVSEIIFGVSGDNSYAKATLLQNMWNHTDNDIENPFSEAYQKL